MPTPGKLGKLPPHSDLAQHPRLTITPALTGLPAAPGIVDYLSQVAGWPVYDNDKWGDCVFAAIGHAVEATTTYGAGTTLVPSSSDILAAYSAVTGFDPSAGPPGDNPTDRGTVLQDALDYWRKTGIGQDISGQPYKILAFFQVDHTQPAQVRDCLAMFGHLLVGFNFPASAMDQFTRGAPWSVVTNDGGIVDGHAVDLGYDIGSGNQYEGVSWGTRQKMTGGFWREYVDECWGVIDQRWINANGLNPQGVNLTVLGDRFTQLTGQPSPFQIIPTPSPGPLPPVVDPRDTAFLARIGHRVTMAQRRGTGVEMPFVRAIEEFAKSKGLEIPSSRHGESEE